MHPAVFLDRDNTLIRNDGDLGDATGVELIQGAASAVASLRGLGFRVVVVTNQGGIARGKYKEADVHAVHARLNDLIAYYANGARIDAFYFCPYHPEGNLKQYKKEHPDRKPQPGMLLRAAEELGLDLAASWTVGDQVRDVQAGAAAGTRTILLRADAQHLQPIDPAALAGLAQELERSGSEPPRRVPDFFARDLVEAVRIIAQQRRPEPGANPKLAGKLQGRKWDAAAIAELQRTGRPPRPEAESDAEAEAPASGSAHAPEPGAQATRAASPSAAAEADKTRPEPKPFRPWGAAEPKVASDSPIAKALRAKRRGEREAAEAAPPASPPEAPAPDPTPARAEAAPEPVASPPPASDAEPASMPVGELSPPAAVSSEVEPRPAPAASGGIEPSMGVLKQILQELRAQRGEQAGFSSLTVVAIVLQMVAALCLVGALWMGADNLGLFVRWICAGVLVQLAVIAMLLFSRQT